MESSLNGLLYSYICYTGKAQNVINSFESFVEFWTYIAGVTWLFTMCHGCQGKIIYPPLKAWRNLTNGIARFSLFVWLILKLTTDCFANQPQLGNSFVFYCFLGLPCYETILPPPDTICKLINENYLLISQNEYSVIYWTNQSRC